MSRHFAKDDWRRYTNVPPPGPTASDHLAHVLDLYDSPPTDFAITSTVNVYGPNERTGLTWADLVEIKAQLDAPQVETCNWCPDGPLVRYHPRGQVAHVPGPEV